MEVACRLLLPACRLLLPACRLPADCLLLAVARVVLGNLHAVARIWDDSTRALQHRTRTARTHDTQTRAGIHNSTLFVRGLKRMRPGYAWDDDTCRWSRRVGPERAMTKVG